ncbi:MAG: xanthine dehydrogenase family protein molybdopterin-binding subunit [Steroidobacteraceae bacterium]
MSAQEQEVIRADLSRRGFLKASATLGGGLVIALTLPGCDNKPAALAGPAVGGQPNAWLRIGGDDSITVLVDRSEMGQGVYTALPMLLAEELEVPVEKIKVEAAPAGDAYINNLLGTQITGGSTSVRDAWVKLRTAGAQARHMLIAAAAQAWDVDASQCRAAKGTVVNAHGKMLSYGALAEAASKLPAPKDVKLKPYGDFRIVGQGLSRTDSASKVDGSAEYGLDVKLPGMLYASLAQSPVLGGKVKSFDAAAAEKMPGVVKVVNTSSGVAVVAQHFWQARQARDAVKIQWDEGSNARLDNAAIRATLKKGAASGQSQPALSTGDAAAALKSASKTITAVYELPLLAHATLEPQNCTADFKADGCDVYVGTQVQLMAQAAAAKAAGLDATQVRIHTTLLGGGFGRRLDVDFIPAAVEVSKAVGKPVKLIWTREDDTTHDTYRPPAYHEIAGGFDAKGALTAWKFHLTSPSITARMFPSLKGIDPFAIEAAVNYPYDVPNVAVAYTRQEIGIDVGYLRSVSHALNCFTAESFMDELAHAAGKDPYQFRVELLGKKPRHKRVLQETAKRADWGRIEKGHYQGIALMEGYGTFLAQVAEISIEGGRLKIHRIACGVDCGRMVNPKIVESQVFSSIVFGLTSTLWGEISLQGGKVQQHNFNQYRLLRANEMPVVEVHLLDSEEDPGGIGEPGTALVAPALCNAIFAATGRRIRALPIATQKVVSI